ncbi:MAG TPA: winged helix DNA-binding domain-containing protein [Candidatus Limnocylindria bacterium]|nr:winged helix DNA-binding domain-containing protein [Candidatus Limnocylindria bacterium]
MTPRTLTPRQLNRALLARQLLLERASGGIEAAVEQVGGLQTQNAKSGYIGLWSRLEGLRKSDYTDALNDRRLIQGWLMRVTIHTVSAADYWPMAIAVREARRTWWLRTWSRTVGEVDPQRAADAIAEELAAGPLRQRDLQARMAARGFSKDVVNGAALWIDLVRVPPQGTWERPRADNYGIAADWIAPQPMDKRAARERLMRQYLGAYGPAALADAAGWTGIPVAGLRPIIEGMELRRFRDEDGRELLDLPGAPLPDPEAPAPARFLGSFDPVLMVHARRTGILPEEFRPIVFSIKAPQSFHTFLLDGRVAGTWRHEDDEIRLEPLRRLTPQERRELEEEAHRLSAFHAE